MLETITQINITQDMTNLTGFQKVQAISTQPYFVTGLILIFGILMIFWFFGGFFRVSENSRKVCFQSWIHLRFLLVILLAALAAILWYIYPAIFII